MELGRQRTLIFEFIRKHNSDTLHNTCHRIQTFQKKPHQHRNTTKVERKHEWINTQSKTKTRHTFLFLLLLPKHTPQRHLGTTQQRNAQRKPTTRGRIQPRRRGLPQRRALQRHKRNRMLELRSRRCSRQRRNPLIHRGRRVCSYPNERRYTRAVAPLFRAWEMDCEGVQVRN
jgi:hypothetical protein